MTSPSHWWNRLWPRAVTPESAAPAPEAAGAPPAAEAPAAEGPPPEIPAPPGEPVTPAPEEPPPPPDPCSLPPALAVGLCNEHFRIHRNVQQLLAEGHDSREARGIRRSLEALADLLREGGVLALDPTGRRFDDRDQDFEPIGVEEVAGLDADTITLCERPAIFLGGRLTQRARGIVGRSAPLPTPDPLPQEETPHG